MSRAKIAPILCGFFADSPTGLEYPGYDDARRELRALLAVARAAREERCRCSTPFPPGCPHKLTRALSRLDKVSR